MSIILNCSMTKKIAVCVRNINWENCQNRRHRQFSMNIETWNEIKELEITFLGFMCMQARVRAFVRDSVRLCVIASVCA